MNIVTISLTVNDKGEVGIIATAKDLNTLAELFAAITAMIPKK